MVLQWYAYWYPYHGMHTIGIDTIGMHTIGIERVCIPCYGNGMHTITYHWYTYHGIAMVCIPWYNNGILKYGIPLVLQWYEFHGIAMV
jgi:hypothetical protein